MPEQQETALAKAYALVCTGQAAAAHDGCQIDLATWHTLLGEIREHIEQVMS